MSWTNEQQLAIDERGKSLLVSAAAGSGKTAVLVERIIKKITDSANPVAIDELLVVTFTNAAANEMKGRIGAALNEALKQAPDSKYLYEQSLLLNKAQITTLHSFCLELVRSHFYRLDIAPNMKIANEIESALLKQEALETIMEDYYTDENKSPKLIALADRWGGKEDEGIAALILRLYEQSMSMPQPKAWLQDLSKKLVSTPWITLFMPIIQNDLGECANYLHKAAELCQDEEGLQGYYERFYHEEQIFQRLLMEAAKGWDNLVLVIKEAGSIFERLPAVKKDSCDETIKEQGTIWRNKAKEQYKKLVSFIGERTEAEIIAEILEQEKYVNDLVEMTLAFSELYQQKKQAKDLMDFDDMEHYALKLLYDEREGELNFSALSLELKEQYHEVLVDEYQDINDLQEFILQAVSRENNLFMVGDIKQSIYGFRMANPQLFLKKYQQYPVDDNASSQKRIDLNCNFRCRENIIKAVNDLFGVLMIGQKGDLIYDDKAALVFGANYPSNERCFSDEAAQLILIEKQQEDDEQDLASAALEVKVAAETINRMLAETTQIFDKQLNRYRDITYRDIVILLRSPKSVGEELIEQLELEGIPSYIDSGDGYFAAWEIQIVLALLNIIDNPLQDIPLAAVLRAPFFAFTEEELAQIRLINRTCPLYQCLELVVQESDNALSAKTADFLERLTWWRTLARRTDISTLIWQLYKETGFYDYVGALNHGVQRQANLRAIHEKSRQFEETSYSGLFMFLRFIQKMQDNNQDMEPAKVLGENENVVRIMSIHKSKGLEFPVVILMGVAKRFNQQDIHQDIVLDKDLGLGLSMVKPEMNQKYPTICQHLIKNRLYDAMLTEEKRVLYVAFTRAREQLVVIGAVNNAAQKVENCALKPAQNAQCYLDWILPVVKKQAMRQSDGSNWRLNIVDNVVAKEADSDFEAAFDLECIKEGRPLECDGTYDEIIAEQLSWQYPDWLKTTIVSKVAVTEIIQQLKGQTVEKKENEALKVYGFTKRPQTMQVKKGLTAAEKGSLIHLFMRHVSLERKIDLDYLETLAAHLEAEQFILSGAADEIDLTVIEKFFQTPLGERMQKAKRIYRELPFAIGIDSRILDGRLPEDTKPVLLQGIIDCVWEEDDGFVLIDYKSDYIGEKNEMHFVQKYGEQVKLYAQAIEKIWKKPVKEKYIFLFSENRCIAL